MGFVMYLTSGVFVIMEYNDDIYDFIYPDLAKRGLAAGFVMILTSALLLLSTALEVMNKMKNST